MRAGPQHPGMGRFSPKTGTFGLDGAFFPPNRSPPPPPQTGIVPRNTGAIPNKTGPLPPERWLVILSWGSSPSQSRKFHA